MVVRVVVLMLLVTLTACEALTGVPVQPRAQCRGPQLASAASSADPTREAGAVYGHVYCDNVTYADTVVWP
jgi:hypothetical protein